MKKIKLSLIAYTLIFGAALPVKACLMCNEGQILQEKHRLLYGQDGEYSDGKLFETPNFYIYADNYPVCRFHILIIPKNHWLSYSVIDINLEMEVEAIINTLSNVTKAKNYSLFEHGSNMIDSEQVACGNSVYHAHMHFIPNLDISFKEIVDLCSKSSSDTSISLNEGRSFNDYYSQRQQNQPIIRYLKMLPTKRPYLFCYYSHSRRESLCIPDDSIANKTPSQFFRRVFAEYFQKAAGKIFWNWKDTQDVERSTEFRKNLTEETIKSFSDKQAIKNLFDAKLIELKAIN